MKYFWMIVMQILLVLCFESKSIHFKNVNAAMIENTNNSFFEYSKRNENSLVKHLLAREFFTSELKHRYQKLQKLYSNKSSSCMAGSYEYNGTCIYFSKKSEKLTWLGAEKFCRKLPLNTSFLIIHNDHHLEFLRRVMVKIKEKENPKDQLVFLVGFFEKNDIWTWINGVKVNESNLTQTENLLESNSTNGACGSIALNKLHEFQLKSAPCVSTNMRFACEYSLNPCYFKDICGKNGICINLYQTFSCDCYPFFTGKYCESYDTKAIQILIGLLIVAILVLFISCLKIKQSKLFQNKKSNYQTNSTKKEIIDNNLTNQLERGPPDRTISKIIRKYKSLAKKHYLITKNFIYVFKVSHVIGLTLIQIFFIHSSLDSSKLSITLENSSFIKFTCNQLDKYLVEELIYFLFVLLNYIVIVIVQKKRRFTNRIMKKYQNYFEKEELKNKSKYSKNKKFLSEGVLTPSVPFSTVGRSITSAVYVIYTYDVLNIIMSLYTDSISSSLVSIFNINKFSGIIVDLFFQILQVFLIGIKFYPILMASDADPNFFMYFFIWLYLLFIFFVRFLNKAFCSQKQEFAKRTLAKISENFKYKIMSTLELRYNVSNKILSVLSDDPSPNEKYIHALKSAIPSQFLEMFGKIVPEFNATAMSERVIMNNFPIPANYYNSSDVSIKQYKSINSSTESFRAHLKNKTSNVIKKLSDRASYEFGHYWDISISMVESFPFYIAMSYLLVVYGFKWIEIIIYKIRPYLDPTSTKRKEMNEKDKKSEKILKENINIPNSENFEFFGSQKSSKDTTLNHNYKYIYEIFSKKKLFSIQKNNNEISENKLNLPLERNSSNKSFKDSRSTSFLLNLFEKHIYQHVPHMKFSKQFINTYTVAFMIIYFLTLYSLKVSDVFSKLIVKLFYLLFKFILSDFKPFFDIDDFNFKFEFQLASIITTFIVILQLFLSIGKFRKDLLNLHRGEYFFSSVLIKDKNRTYSKVIKKSNKSIAKTTADSLHFSGYLISHMVYGYFLIFFGVFMIVVLSKFFYYLPRGFMSILQIFLPLFIIISFKYIIIRFLTKFVIIGKNNNNLYKIAPYYIASYFYFFFDCFLGIASCMSRTMLSQTISMLTLARIDVSMFNQEHASAIKNLDQAYIAYSSYLKMEHSYNNPIVNGFCEIIIDSWLSFKTSDLAIFNSKPKFQKDENEKRYTRTLSVKKEGQTTYKTIEEIQILDQESQFKNIPKSFKIKSFKRLRNILFLVIFLNKNQLLRNFREHKIREKLSVDDSVETFGEAVNRLILDKLKELINMVKE